MSEEQNRIRVANEQPAYAKDFAKDDLFDQFEMNLGND